MTDRIEDGGPALLPCPFCGCTDVSCKDDGDFMWFECDWCHATSGYDPEADLEAPEYHWNRRDNADIAPDLLAALEAIVASLTDQDDEGMIEHAEQMIAARAVIARARQLGVNVGGAA